MAGRDPLRRLLGLIDIKWGQTDACWPWRGCVDKDGYGRFVLNGKILRSHRAVVLLLKGEPLTYDLTTKSPPKRGSVGARREVRHLRYNSGCCNPAHIEYSNHSRNMKDVVAAGNFKSPTQKLKPEDYVAICASSESSLALAKRFGINRGHVYDIWKGKYGVGRI